MERAAAGRPIDLVGVERCRADFLDPQTTMPDRPGLVFQPVEGVAQERLAERVVGEQEQRDGLGVLAVQGKVERLAVFDQRGAERIGRAFAAFPIIVARDGAAVSRRSARLRGIAA